MNYTTTKKIADEIVATLAPFCERIEIAGSVRREKQDGIHDVEVVAISKRPVLAFGGSTLPLLHKRTDELRAESVMLPRLDKLNRPAWGEKFRRAKWNDVPFDLFIATPETWGVIFTIRTGNADFSHLLVTKQWEGGAMPNDMFVCDGRLWNDHELYTPEEKDVFKAIGLEWIEPHNRTAETLKAALKVKP